TFWQMGADTATTYNNAFYIYNGSERVISIDRSGKVGIGTNSPTLPLHVVSTSGMAVDRYNDSASGGYLMLRHSRGSESSPTTVATDDELGKILFYGYNGSTFVNTAEIRALGNGTVSGGNVPAALSFRTGSTTTSTERMKITSTGDVIITLG
ncbi:hypothetical protein JW711_03890, partial [Candidatus Woesearchaeota archaeon]|nr:hypothetical protein [Candidatus Woesearchaeota archaeon]